LDNIQANGGIEILVLELLVSLRLEALGRHLGLLTQGQRDQ
jgi:hypothetical protein